MTLEDILSWRGPGAPGAPGPGWRCARVGGIMQFGVGEILVVVFLVALVVGTILLKRGEGGGAGKE